VSQPFFIGIDGHGGAGKSTLARQLAERFDAGVVQTDDFATEQNPLDWWPLVIEHVFEPIRRGATELAYPVTYWFGDERPPVEQPVKPVMILEGVSALRREFRPYLDFGIFVNTPPAIAIARGIERDQDELGDEAAEFWAQWQASETFYIARDDPASYADVVVDGTTPIDVDAIMDTIRRSQSGPSA